MVSEPVFKNVVFGASWKFPAVILGPCPKSLKDFLCIYISALMCWFLWLEKIN